MFPCASRSLWATTVVNGQINFTRGGRPATPVVGAGRGCLGQKVKMFSLVLFCAHRTLQATPPTWPSPFQHRGPGQLHPPVLFWFCFVHTGRYRPPRHSGQAPSSREGQGSHTSRGRRERREGVSLPTSQAAPPLVLFWFYFVYTGRYRPPHLRGQAPSSREGQGTGSRSSRGRREGGSESGSGSGWSDSDASDYEGGVSDRCVRVREGVCASSMFPSLRSESGSGSGWSGVAQS